MYGCDVASDCATVLRRAWWSNIDVDGSSEECDVVCKEAR